MIPKPVPAELLDVHDGRVSIIIAKVNQIIERQNFLIGLVYGHIDRFEAHGHSVWNHEESQIGHTSSPEESNE